MRRYDFWGPEQALTYPLITRGGRNQTGKPVHYDFNYPAQPGTVRYPHGAGRELLAGTAVS